jgi:hypothetical protein
MEVPAWFIVERQRILEAAKRLKQRAAFLGMEAEVAALIAPQLPRKRGRQKGSHSSRLAKSRERLWEAYQIEKADAPSLADRAIAERLRQRDKSFGNSIYAVAKRISELKKSKATEALTLLGAVGNGPRRGRPQKNPAAKRE